MFDLSLLAVLIAAFLAAGCVKGIVGFGLPTVALAGLALTTDPRTAIAMVVIPALATNIVQALHGPGFWRLLRRLASLIAGIVLGILIGTRLIIEIPPAIIGVALGMMVAAYGAAGVYGLSFPPVGRREAWIAPPVGVAGGVVTGLTGTFLIPHTMYLASLALTRAELVQAIGIVFTVSSLVLGIGLARVSVLTWDLAVLSTLALVPALVGMGLGRRISSRLSEHVFRRVFFWSLLGAGSALIVRNVV
ncbi:MAG: sulfite exporter TauE/SafE family protein [Hyphomicrobiaceae bacterium]